VYIEELESFVNKPLLSPITKRFTDHSTQKVFVFSFFCDQCGKEWRSTPQAFDPGGLRSPTDLRIFRMLWNDQHKAAYEQANLDAIYTFSFCPECGRRVCMECLYRCEAEITDICMECLSK
jgi:rRNA maturation protein Nop10